jgi:hypothetical protein
MGSKKKVSVLVCRKLGGFSFRNGEERLCSLEEVLQSFSFMATSSFPRNRSLQTSKVNDCAHEQQKLWKRLLSELVFAGVDKTSMWTSFTTQFGFKYVDIDFSREMIGPLKAVVPCGDYGLSIVPDELF